jgi:alcohol dehydrogenase
VRGLVLDGPGAIRVRDDLPDPVVEAPTDAVLRVARAGLCGSDLHPYEGRERVRPGVVPGHEAVGEVVAVGDAVRDVAVGDRVLAAFTTSCGRCHACAAGRSSRCEHGQLFGYGDPDDTEAPALHGAQAEQIRVPLADGTLVRVPDGIDDVTAVLLTDNLPTGWVAAARAEVVDGDTVAVLGLGSVGLCSLLAARALGAATVVAVDPVATRRAAASHLGVEVATGPDEVRSLVDRLRAGGIDAVIDATGSTAGLRLAIDLLRPGGRCSVIGVQTATSLPLTPAEAYDLDLTLRFGRAPVRSVLDEVLGAMATGRLEVPTERLLTHPAVPLDDGPATYAAFAAREAGLVKAAFVP